MNVQGVQLKGNPGAAPAGEFQRNDQVLLLSHLLFRFLEVFYTTKPWGSSLFARRKSLSSVANKCWVLGLPQSGLLDVGVRPCPHPSALSGAALAHRTASLLSWLPFTDAPPSPVLLCPFLLLAPSSHFCCCSLLDPSPVVSFLQPLQPALLKPFPSAREDLPVTCACHVSSPLSCCLTLSSEPFGFSPGFDPCACGQLVYPSCFCSPLSTSGIIPPCFALSLTVFVATGSQAKASLPKFMTFLVPRCFLYFQVWEKRTFFLVPPTFFKPHLVAYGISVPLPGIERGTWQKAWNSNH